MEQAKTKPNFKYLPLILLVSGIIGLAASLILTADTFKLLKDPSYVPTCNLNPIISCGSVMKTSQSAVFGFPNSVIGVGLFSVLTFWAAALYLGVKFSRRLWRILLAILTSSFLFVLWLIFQSLYRIGSLCPFCMAVWLFTSLSFWYTAVYVLSLAKTAPRRLSSFIIRHHTDIYAVSLLLLIGLILKRFWYYWSSLI